MSLRDELPLPSNDPGAVRERAEEILSRPEYKDPPTTLFDRINEWITDFVNELLSLVGYGGGSVAPIVAWLVMAALVAGLAALIWWVVGSGRWSEGRVRRDRGDPVILATEAHRSAREWRSEAEAHEAAGRWREGLLCRYRALVVELVERKVIPDQPGRTAGEYVRDVAEHHRAGSVPFAAATELFEATWYGRAPTGPDERDRFVALAAQVLRPQEIGAGT
ncbi:MAG TPA: DUF4129 domain-containing protein [Acidimicrobiales bacterium]